MQCNAWLKFFLQICHITSFKVSAQNFFSKCSDKTAFKKDSLNICSNGVELELFKMSNILAESTCFELQIILKSSNILDCMHKCRMVLFCLFGDRISKSVVMSSFSVSLDNIELRTGTCVQKSSSKIKFKNQFREIDILENEVQIDSGIILFATI